MEVAVVSIILKILTCYLSIGLIFSIVFHWKGIKVVDEGAKGTGVFFKLLITPGIIVMWPFLLTSWVKVKRNESKS